MPNVVIQAIMFVGTLVMEALPIIEVVFGIGGGTMFVTGALAITAGVVGMSKLMEMSLPRPDSNYARQKTVRTTTAPVKRVYGEALISGPVAFMGVGGTGNQDLWHVIALTGDKSESITDIYLDNVIIPNADINSGNAAGGIVNGTTTIFRPIDSTTLVTVYKYTGSQTAVSQQVSNEFFKWTSDHKGQGLTYIATKFSFPDNEKIAEVWNKYNPQDIKALVKGMAIYDPRKDSTSDEYDSSLGVSTHRLADSTTWQWSDNPALCLANYIIDDEFGMGVPSSAIDWSAVHVAADYADALVSIPDSQTQKRFTCNGVLYGTDSHAQNINKILSSMNGSLVYSSGKYVMQAGQYIAPESDAILTDDDLTGPINITVANTRDSRFNTIKGTHFNPLDLHKKVAFPEVQLTDIATRDAGEVLYKEVELPMTNDVYMCQRLTYQMINRSNDQMLIEFPCNLKALRYTVGDRVKITLDKFAGSDQDSISFNQTPFVILGFNFSAEGAVTLTLLKDTQANYTDMPAGNYSSIASDGSITDGFSGVPAPQNLDSVVNGHDVRLTWDNPVPSSTFNDIIVYRSETSNFSDSSIFLRTKSDAVTFVLPSSALTRYYWVRAALYDNEVAATDIIIGQTYRIRTLGTTNWVSLGATAPVSNGDTFLATSSGTSSSGTGVATDESAVSAVVGPETVTTTDQVADSVEWIDVDDTAGLKPDDNATVGATLGTDVFDGQAQAYAVGDLLNSNGFFRFTRTSNDDDVSAPADAAAFNTAFGRAPTDGDIVVVTNTTSSPNKQAAYQYNGSTFGTISGFFAGDLIIDDTITAAALSVTELGAITADLGTITGGTLKGGGATAPPDADAAPSGSESGSFFDLDGGKFVVGDATNNLLFDGSSLSVTGSITATSGTFAGSVNVNSSGKMYGGTMSSFNTGAGFFLGYDTDAYKLSVGDSSGEVLTWDGSKLNVEANTVSFATGGEQDYSSESRYTTSQKSATVVLANNSSYFLFDNRRQDLAFPDFIVSYYLGPLTSGTQSSQANARNGIMDSIKVELFYADASTGSPGTWTSFRSITADSWYTDTGTNYVFSNFRVKDSGSYVASLDTRNGILDDYPTMSPFGDAIDGTSVPVGLVDNDYFINIPISRNTVVFPKGRYFIKVVITVTDGSLSPYPSTGSPTATERRVSIPNASSFVHPDFGQAVFVGGAHTTIFTDNNRDNETLIKGGSVYLMSKEGANAADSDSTAIFFGGRGTTGGTPNSAYGPLHGLYFFNDRDSIGSGSGILGSIGNPNFAMYVPYDGSKLTFEGDANFLNGLYINGVAVNAGAVTGPAGSDTQVQYNNGGSLGASANFTFNDSTNTLTVQNLTVSGTTTTVNTDNLTVKDPNITLNYATGDSSSTANNAGITIQDAVNATTDASILWKTASDTFEFSHAVTWPSGSSTNANTAYTYSQVGHLPLAGGTMSGILKITPTTNVGAPDTDNHNTGTRLTLYDASATSWYALGIESSTMWFTSDSDYKWYEGEILQMHLDSANLTVTGTLTSSNSPDWDTAFDYGPNEYKVNATAEDAQSGTWTETNSSTSWGSIKYGAGYAYTDTVGGYKQFNIPSGYDTCYMSHLTWSGGGYVDVHGVQADGDLVFLKRVSTYQDVKTSNEGNAAEHDGQTTICIGTGLDNFSSIRITNKSGRFHFTGVAFTKEQLAGVGGQGIFWGEQIRGPMSSITSLAASSTITATGNITSQAAIQGDTIKLTNNVTDTTATRFSVYDSGGTTHGMMLWNTDGTSGDWSTMIFGPNQSNRRVSFGKVTNNAFTLHEHVTEVGYWDLDDGSLNVKGYTSSDAALYLLPQDGDSDSLVQWKGQEGITTEGFEIWYDNNVGNVHLHTTYENAAANIDFQTKTGASKSSSNVRLRIEGDGDIIAYNDLQVTDVLQVGPDYYTSPDGVIISGNTSANFRHTTGWSSAFNGGYLANCLNNWDFIIHDAAHALTSPFSYVGGTSRYFEAGRDVETGVWGATDYRFKGDLFADGDFSIAGYLIGNVALTGAITGSKSTNGGYIHTVENTYTAGTTNDAYTEVRVKNGTTELVVGASEKYVGTEWRDKAWVYGLNGSLALKGYNSNIEIYAGQYTTIDAYWDSNGVYHQLSADTGIAMEIGQNASEGLRFGLYGHLLSSDTHICHNMYYNSGWYQINSSYRSSSIRLGTQGTGETGNNIDFLYAGTGDTTWTTEHRLAAANAFVAMSGGYLEIGTQTASALHVGTKIGTRNGISVDVDGSDSQLVIKSGTYDAAFGVLSWNNQTYLSQNIYLDGGAWVHDSYQNSNNNSLFKIGADEITWYSSNSGSGSWNVAEDVQLFNQNGYMTADVTTNNFRSTEPHFLTSETLELGDYQSSWGHPYISMDSGWAGGTYPTIGSTGGSVGGRGLIMLSLPHVPSQTISLMSGKTSASDMRFATNTNASSYYNVGCYTSTTVSSGFRIAKTSVDYIWTSNAATETDVYFVDNVYADGGNLVIGDHAFNTSSGYVGMKTSYQTGADDYMIISGTTDGNTYVSAKNGSGVYIRGGGNASNNQIAVTDSTTITATTSNFYVTGNVTAYSSSDERLKHNVRNIQDPLKKLHLINGVHFDWSDEFIDRMSGGGAVEFRKDDVGVIAQQVKQVLDEVVAERDDGYLAVKYEKLTPLLIEGLKEADRKIEAQQKQIDQLIKLIGEIKNGD
jgi:hypothetical protein